MEVYEIQNFSAWEDDYDSFALFNGCFMIYLCDEKFWLLKETWVRS